MQTGPVEISRNENNQKELSKQERVIYNFITYNIINPTETTKSILSRIFHLVDNGIAGIEESSERFFFFDLWQHGVGAYQIFS